MKSLHKTYMIIQIETKGDSYPRRKQESKWMVTIQRRIYISIGEDELVCNDFFGVEWVYFLRRQEKREGME